MKRKMIGAASAFLSGLFFASFFAMGSFGFLRSIVFLLIPGSVIVVLSGKKRGFHRADYVILALSFTAAVLYFCLFTALRYEPVMEYSGASGSFSGEITEYDLYDGEMARYVLKGRINGDIKAKITVYTDELDADYGDIVNIGSCMFGEIEDSYLYSTRDNYRSKGIFLTAKKAKEITVTHTSRGKLRSALSSYRQLMTDRLFRVMGADCGGFMAGMLFGEKRYLESSVRISLYRCGIGHILAVSGLHITLAAYLGMLLLKRLPIGRGASFFLINLLFGFLIITARFPVSAFRALLMLEISYSAALFKRESDPFNSLAAAVMLMCIHDPYIIFSSGFILSASGTFGIAVLAPYMTKNMVDTGRWPRLKKLVVTCLCTSAAVMPASVCFFDETSLISPIMNVFVVPLCSASLMLGLFYIITGGFFGFVLSPAILMLKAVIKISEIAAKAGIMRLASQEKTVSMLLILSMITAFFVHLYFNDRSVLGIFLSVSVTLCILFSCVERVCGRGNITVAMLGKDRVSAAVLTVGGHACIIDMGSGGDGYAEKYLTLNGIDKIDALVLTRNINWAYSAYYSRLSLFSVKETFSLGDSPVNAPEALTVAAGSLGFRMDGCEIDITAEGFTVTDTLCGSSVCSVYLSPGNTKKRRTIVTNARYTKLFTASTEGFSGTADDGGCNYEIILSHDGQYKIRSLYG